MNQQDVLSRLDVERQTVPDADAVLERTQSVLRMIAKLGNRDAIEYFLQLETEIWGASFTTREFLRFNQSDPLRRDLALIAYMDEKPAGMARVTASSQSQFAGLWGGSVLNEYRGRGVYRSLLSARILRAKELKSTRYLRVDALRTSRPILEKYGFSRVGSTWPAVWPPR